MKYIYAPGCALMTYKPHIAERLKVYVERKYGVMDTLLTCCFDKPALANATCVVTPCPTCADAYNKMEGITAVCFLNDIANDDDFPFPDYRGMEMSIQDTCAARKQPEVLASVRTLLERMNIRVIEPQFTGKKARCCGQIFYGKMGLTSKSPWNYPVSIDDILALSWLTFDIKMLLLHYEQTNIL